MSLINDALQRAKAVQESSARPPISPLKFRPAESAQQTRRGPGLVIAAALGIVLVAGVLLWVLLNRHPATDKTHEAQLPVHAAVSPETVPPTPAPEPPAPATSNPRPDSSAPPATSSAAAAPAAMTLPVAAPEPPKPAAPRLQAVIFSPVRPSAIVNGKTVFVGERVREFRVTAISEESVTLVSATETNVLTLE